MAGMLLCITVAVFALIRLRQQVLMLAAALTFAAMFSMYHLVSPRPWLFTILFFLIELIVLMRARLSGDTRILLWLPPLFALGANIHIQFIDGIVVLAFAVIESFFTRTRSHTARRQPAVDRRRLRRLRVGYPRRSVRLAAVPRCL